MSRDGQVLCRAQAGLDGQEPANTAAWMETLLSSVSVSYGAKGQLYLSFFFF